MLLALDLASKCSTLWYRLWCLCSPSFRNNDKQTELDLVEVRPASAAHFLVSNPNVVSVFGFPLPITSFIRIFVTTFCRCSIHRSTSPSHLHRELSMSMIKPGSSSQKAIYQAVERISRRIPRSTRVAGVWSSHCGGHPNSHAFTTISRPPTSPSSSTNHQDLTLIWASTHRDEAQACLDQPSTDPLTHKNVPSTLNDNNKNQHHAIPMNSFEDFWKWRDWTFPVTHADDTIHGQRLVTHVLSEPLSLACHLLPAMTHATGTYKSSLQICCIGARAEALLPPSYWKEVVQLAVQILGWNKLHLTLDFIGPEILRRPSVKESCGALGSVTLRWLYNGKFHEYMDHSKKAYVRDGVAVAPPEQDTRWDGMVMCNPGIGHPHLREGWRPTLELLLSGEQTTRKTPVLLTAHSWTDAQRDGLVLTDYLLPQAPLYKENPWASRIQYQDPLVNPPKVHMVQPNHYFHVITF